MNLIKERPILFSAPMVQAILEGRKTQTRRIFKDTAEDYDDDGHPIVRIIRGCKETLERAHCPYGKLGGRLWVRENYYIARRYSYGTYPSGEPMEEPKPKYCKGDPVHYSADGVPENTPNASYPSGLRNGLYAAPDPYAIWRHFPSIHMPRWASRIDLLITAVRVERLHDISEDDAQAEGVYSWAGMNPLDISARLLFKDLWVKINGPESWAANPWVWAVEFERIKP